MSLFDLELELLVDDSADDVTQILSIACESFGSREHAFEHGDAQ